MRRSKRGEADAAARAYGGSGRRGRRTSHMVVPNIIDRRGILTIAAEFHERNPGAWSNKRSKTLENILDKVNEMEFRRMGVS